MSVLTLARGFSESKIHEKYSRQRILRLQQKKFRKILKFAYKNSKFYHDLYESNGIKEENLDSIDIEKIPTVNKTSLMDNFDKVVTVDDVSKKEVLDFFDKSVNPNELFKNKYHIIHTSGSSGKLGIYVYSKKEWDTFFPYITKLFNFNFKRNRSSFIGATGGHFTGNSFISWSIKGLVGFFCEPLILDVNEPIDNVVKKLNDFQPHILGGYFNALKVLAQKQEEGILKVKPRVITNCGEGINKKDKEYIEKVFNAPMSNLYGFAECVVTGFGRSEYDGIYLMDDICLIEIKEDHLLLTNLFNKTEPIIRYRIDDYVKLKEDKKKLLPFTLVDDIVGRAEFVIWFENEHGKMDFIHPLIFTDFYVNGLDKLQIAIKSKSSFEFRAVISSDDKKEVIKKIAEKLDKILEEKHFKNVKYTIKEVSDLKSDKKTGKFRLIVNET
jgi:phenylacetate-CoA ligase